MVTLFERLSASCALAMLATVTVAAPARLPVILDTDIGTDIDDAFALALVLASPELDLRGVTTVSDDAYTRAMIACRFLHAAGRRDIPVAAGRPLRETPAIQGQYQYGLRASYKQPERELAVEFLYQQLKARQGEITIITVGDLTNLGELITRHPDARPWIKRVVIMGGSIRVGYRGQPPPEREWNIRSDVKSAQVLFRSGIPLVVAPLDATLVRFPEPFRRRVFETRNAICQELWSLYELWDKPTPTLFDPVAVALAFNESFVTMERLRIEVDDQGITREAPGEPNCHVAMSIRANAFLDWYAQRIVGWRSEYRSAKPPQPGAVGPSKPANLVQPVPRGPMPHRIHVAEDYETDIERRWWLAGKLSTNDVPPGSTRACRAVPCNDFDEKMGDPSALYKAVIFNPVPGPPMGRNPRLSFQYRLDRTDTLRVQIFSLSKGYHRQLTLTGLPQRQWQSATVDMTQARRHDGSGGALSEDERIDDLQFYVDRNADLLIDNIVLHDAAPAQERRPFPRRIHFTGWFDTGQQGKEWPGDFQIVAHEQPLTWFAAKSVPHLQSDEAWLRVRLRGLRPVGKRSSVRFRYRLTGGDQIKVELAHSNAQEQSQTVLTGLASDRWSEATAEFAIPAEAARQAHRIDEIRFLIGPRMELWVDDVLIYEDDDEAQPWPSTVPRERKQL